MDPISKLENLPEMISADKATILLVEGDLKPSALVIMQGDVFPLTEEPIHVSEQSIEDLTSILTSFGIFYYMTTEIMEGISDNSDEVWQEVLRVFISKNKSVAKRLKELFDDIGKNHAEAGHLLGYPETAVDAFLTDKMLPLEDHPVSTPEVSEINMRMLGHRLSKDNWRNEVMYLEPSGNYIKAKSRKIYDDFTGISNNN